MRRIAVVLVALLAAACMKPKVPHPLSGESRYLCCNMHYERDKIADTNYLRGTMISLGTRVQILEVGRSSVKFQPEGHPPITLVLRHAKKTIGMDAYLDRVFVREDPRTKLPRPTGRKQAPEAEKTRKMVEQGVVDVGMTKDQVLMSLGYPPPHRTPSLTAPMWTYWANRWETLEVYFDGDRVSRVNR